MNCEALQTFRQEVHKLLTKAKDATFELMDAVMTTRQASSLAEFSLSPMFRRQYPSTYSLPTEEIGIHDSPSTVHHPPSTHTLDV